MTQDPLFQQLKHPNPHLRERAILELAETRDETTIPRLIKLFSRARFQLSLDSYQSTGRDWCRCCR